MGNNMTAAFHGFSFEEPPVDGLLRADDFMAAAPASTADYSGINDEDRETLTRYEFSIKDKVQVIHRNMLEIGMYLLEAEKIWIKYNKDALKEGQEPKKFVEWYEICNLNPSSASVAKKQARLRLKHPEAATAIENMAQAVVKVVTSKEMEYNPDIQEEVIEKIQTGELKNSSEISKYIADKLGRPEKVPKQNSSRVAILDNEAERTTQPEPQTFRGQVVIEGELVDEKTEREVNLVLTESEAVRLLAHLDGELRQRLEDAMLPKQAEEKGLYLFERKIIKIYFIDRKKNSICFLYEGFENTKEFGGFWRRSLLQFEKELNKNMIVKI